MASSGEAWESAGQGTVVSQDELCMGHCNRFDSGNETMPWPTSLLPRSWSYLDGFYKLVELEEENVEFLVILRFSGIGLATIFE